MKLTMILLAAGASRRFGREDKLLFPIEGRPMYRHILDRLIGFTDVETSLFVVTNTPEIQRFCSEHDVPWTDSPEAAEGIAASLRWGLTLAPAGERYCFFVADQPWLRRETIRAFLTQARSSERKLGCIACGDVRGNPAWFDRTCVPELLALRGDRGGRVVLERHRENVFLFQTGIEELQDVDELPLHS